MGSLDPRTPGASHVKPLLKRTWIRGWLSVSATATGAGVQRALGGVLVVAMIAAASRQHGSADAGVIGISTTLAFIAMALADFGTTPMSIREFASRPPSGTDFRTLVVAKVELAVLAALLIVAGSLLLGGRDIGLATAIAAMGVPVSAVTTAATALLVVQGRGAPLVRAAVVGLIGGGAVLATLASVHGPGWSLASAFPVARGAELLALLLSIRFTVAHRANETFELRALIRFWPLAIQGWLAMIYQRSTLLVAAAVLGRIAAGDAAKGLSLYGAIAILPSVFATAAFPRMIRATRPGAAQPAVFVSFAVLSILVVIPFVVLLLLSPQIPLFLLYGDTTPALLSFVRWSALALLMTAPNSLIAFYYVAHHRERMLAMVSIGTTASSIVLTYVGARVAGLAGVGFSIAAAELVTSVAFAVTAHLAGLTTSTRDSLSRAGVGGT